MNLKEGNVNDEIVDQTGFHVTTVDLFPVCRYWDINWSWPGGKDRYQLYAAFIRLVD